MATSVQMPKQGNTVEECLLVEWRVKEGAQVKSGDVLCAIETDKASFEVESTVDGTVLKLLANVGDLVPVLTDIALIGEAGEAVPATVAASGSRNDEPAAPPVASLRPAAAALPRAARAVSPRARVLAEKLGVDVDAASIPGTGVDGRVTSLDIQAAVDSGGAVRVSPLAREVMVEEGLVPGTATGVGGLCLAKDLRERRQAAMAAPEKTPEVVAYKGIRKLIGDRMLQSLNNHAQLTHNVTADAGGLLELRKVYKEKGEGMGLPRIGINDLICWVVAQTLPSFPDINAIFDREAAAIACYRDVNLAFAVDTPRGLMVPVVTGANRMGLADLSRAFAAHAEACRQGSINPDHLAGGTFTVSNLGGFGIESFTPIINGDQVAILGVCAITNVPAPTANGGFEFRPRLGLSLTYDHQAVDGAPASRFLQAVVKGIENIQSTLALYGSF